MASVKFELRNEGKGLHEWDYLPLSEARVVRMQIEHRSQLDAAYEMKLCDSEQFTSPLMSAGVVPMSEPVSVTYLDLERLIDTCGLTKEEKHIVELLMMGYTRLDISETHDMKTEDVTQALNSAVAKIVERNEYEWHRSLATRKKLGFI